MAAIYPNGCTDECFSAIGLSFLARLSRAYTKKNGPKLCAWAVMVAGKKWGSLKEPTPCFHAAFVLAVLHRLVHGRLAISVSRYWFLEGNLLLARQSPAES